MTFTLKINDGRALKVIIETLSTIIDETEIRVTSKEFTIVAMDPSRICLLKLSIGKENFDSYKCTKKSKVGINLDDLNKILKRCSQKDSIVLSYTSDDQKIKLQMQREDTSRKRTFSLALLDIEIDDIPIDNLLKINYPTSWSMDPSILVEAIKDATIYSEILQIVSEEKGLVFSSYGQIGEMEYQLGEDLLTEFTNDGKSSGSYSITFLNNILKLSSVTKNLKLLLKTDHPIHMSFDLIDDSKLEYFLAPRVEEVDFDDNDDYDDDF